MESFAKFILVVILTLAFLYSETGPFGSKDNKKNSVISSSKSSVIKANEIDPMCNIIVYTSTNCRRCDAAVEALESKDVRYCNKDINQSKINMDTYDKLGGGTCGPVAVIGNKIIRGFSYKFTKKSYSRAIDAMGPMY